MLQKSFLEKHRKCQKLTTCFFFRKNYTEITVRPYKCKVTKVFQFSDKYTKKVSTALNDWHTHKDTMPLHL